jgi:O-acetyl-ADP-ribose deacetylase (regulator of RNase III)
MSLEHVKGNLLDFPAGITVIAHSCNGRGKEGVMGAGLALAIKERYPEAFAAYEEARNSEQGLVLGTFSMAKLPDDKRIINLITQERVGNDKDVRYVDYEAFYVAVRTLRDSLEHAHKQGRNYVLGLPYKISCGLANGDWCVILGILECLFKDSPIRCVIVELEK